MEEQLRKYSDLLQQVAHDAGYALLQEEEPAALAFNTRRYNRVVDNLRELDPALVAGFDQLTMSVTPGALRLAARDLSMHLENRLEGEDGEPFAGFFTGWMS